MAAEQPDRFEDEMRQEVGKITFGLAEHKAETGMTCKGCPFLIPSRSAPLVYCKFDSIVRYGNPDCNWSNIRTAIELMPNVPTLEALEVYLGGLK
jgi:hypothetical protein